MTDATVLRGSPAFAAGKFGNALRGGVLYAAGVLSQLVGTLNSSMSSVNMTVEGWIESPASPPAGNRVAFGRDNCLWVGMNAAGQFIAILGSGGSPRTVTTTAKADGGWHHVAVTVTNGVPTIYCDGDRYQVGAGVATFGPASGQPGLCLGGFGTSSATDWVAGLDEVSVSSVVKYSGATYPVPAAPFSATRAYQTNLYHLEADGTDSDGTDLLTPTLGAITISTDGTTDTITYPAPVAGTNPVGGVRLYRGTSPGGEDGTALLSNTGTGGGTFTTPTATDGAYFYYARPVDSLGNVGDATNEVASPPATVIPPTDDGYLFAPYAWHITSARALSINGGYFKTEIVDHYGPTFEMHFDVDNIPATASRRSQISYRVDGQDWVTLVPTAIVSVVIPAATAAWAKHTLEVVVKSTSEAENRWAAPYLTGVKFKGLLLVAGGSLVRPQARALRGLALGDSITEGINTLKGGGEDATARSDSRLSWASALTLGAAVGAEIGQIGFGRQGLAVTGNGSVPVLGVSWDKVADGLPRGLDPAPDFISINIGTNDQRNGVSAAAFQAAATEFLNDVIAKTPRSTRIVWVYPFGAYYAKSVHQAAIAACSDPRRVTFVDTTGWWDTADASDALHPYGFVNQSRLAPLAAAAIRGALNAGRTFRKVGGVLEAVRASRY